MSKEVKNLEHVVVTENEELEDLKNFWNKYGNYITIGVVVICLGVLGKNFIQKKQLEKKYEVQSKFEAADTIQDLEAFLVDNSSSGYAAFARLKLAARYYYDKNYQMALSTYDEFLSKNSKSDFVPVAKLGKAFALESLAKVAEAKDVFASVGLDTFVGFEARLGEARCAIVSGDKEEGKRILDELIIENTSVDWVVNRAQKMLDSIDRLRVIEPKVAANALENFFADTTVPAAEAVAAEVAPVATEAAPVEASEATAK